MTSLEIETGQAAGLALTEARTLPAGRVTVRGKFFFLGEEKFWVRGVTYGTFAPGEGGAQFPPAATVEADFAAMAAAGLNSVRVYTVPPKSLLDLALAHGLRVMVGLPWEQHVTFLDDAEGARSIVARVRSAIAHCVGHPAVFCYAVGNEIPASVVRWYGREKIERFLGQLADAVRAQDPASLITYVNFPTTEYLDLRFADFVSFNVYLETKEKLAAYLARLQNMAVEKPLLMAEIGLDSRRNGDARQAETLAWQIETTFEAGCVGAFIFAWTDEWHRGGHEIDDWDFGLVTRDRRRKPALAAVSRAFAQTPFGPGRRWPRISVVVCSYNGSATIGETLEALEHLDYPDYEVIVVNDGSTDETGAIARRHPGFRLIETENRGLSAARNSGMEAATGEIVAYTDDDAYPDPHWLTYLAAAFERTGHAGIGGPNIAPPQDGPIADCIANAPGGPLHVLVTDELAEHIPGCNMAFRRDRLMAIGGFDKQFRVAGDDVDVCWRLQEQGWTLGFSPAAMVWHHRRPSIKRFWKQQRGYARAEALLAAKWPEKYNSAGHLSWEGRIYGRGVVDLFFQQPRIYHGSWGGALFQSMYQPPLGLFSSLPLMPEWHALLIGLAFLTVLGLFWSPLLWVAPVFLACLAGTVFQALRAGARAEFYAPPHSARELRRLRLIVAWLHVMQPVARLLGRIEYGLGPWRLRDLKRPTPKPQAWAVWDETWRSTEERLEAVEAILRRDGAVVLRGGDFDRWDLTVRGGLFGSARALAMVEEHGAGKQYFRVRAWPTAPRLGLIVLAALGVGAALAAFDGAWIAAVGLALPALAFGAAVYADCAVAMQAWARALQEYAGDRS